jgi:hypothetical protein
LRLPVKEFHHSPAGQRYPMKRLLKLPEF